MIHAFVLSNCYAYGIGRRNGSLAAANQRSGKIVQLKFVIAVSPALLLASSAALCADWVALGVDARGNAWHVDKASIIREDGRVVSWKRIEFQHPHPHFLYGTPTKRVFLRDATDCAQHKVSIKAIGLLDPEGSIISIHEQSDSHTEWPPGTPHGALLEAAMASVCANQPAELR